VTPERWRQVTEILEAAWDREACERTAFLDRACADDPELRSNVEALLASDEKAGEFLAALKRAFGELRHAKPPASRAQSAETYVVAKGFRGRG